MLYTDMGACSGSNDTLAGGEGGRPSLLAVMVESDDRLLDLERSVYVRAAKRVRDRLNSIVIKSPRAGFSFRHAMCADVITFKTKLIDPIWYQSMPLPIQYLPSSAVDQSPGSSAAFRTEKQIHRDVESMRGESRVERETCVVQLCHAHTRRAV